jgi:simple sugar transport system permease protein
MSQDAPDTEPMIGSTPAALAPSVRIPSLSQAAVLTLGRAAVYAFGLLALLALTFAALGIPPEVALSQLWSGAFGDSNSGHLYNISETIIATAPLLLTGLSVIIAWRTGLFSIGAEGQLLVGALAATAVGVHGGAIPGPMLTFAMLIVGGVAGAAWGWIAGWMRVRRNVQEVISTIMLNYVAIYLVRFMVEGPLQERARVNPQSDQLPPGAMFAHLLPRTWSNDIPTRLHTGVALAILAVPLVWLLLYQTSTGFGMRLIGQNADAAKTGRFPVDRLRLQAMCISGALCGVAGVVELLGVTGRLYANFSPGWGYTAIPVALLGGLHPFGAAGSALFFGALTAGSGNLNRFSGVSSVVGNVIQASAVLAVVGARAWQARRAGGETD